VCANVSGNVFLVHLIAQRERKGGLVVRHEQRKNGVIRFGGMRNAEGFGSKAEETEGWQRAAGVAEGAEEIEKGGFRSRRKRLREEREGEVEMAGGGEAAAEEGDRGGIWSEAGCCGGVEEAESGERIPLRSNQAEELGGSERGAPFHWHC
jgi:hypothetical protein